MQIKTFTHRPWLISLCINGRLFTTQTVPMVRHASPVVRHTFPSLSHWLFFTSTHLASPLALFTFAHLTRLPTAFFASAPPHPPTNSSLYITLPSPSPILPHDSANHLSLPQSACYWQGSIAAPNSRNSCFQVNVSRKFPAKKYIYLLTFLFPRSSGEDNVTLMLGRGVAWLGCRFIVCDRWSSLLWERIIRESSYLW